MRIIKKLFPAKESREVENLMAAVEQQKADIAYIAMMTNTELDTEEDTENE